MTKYFIVQGFDKVFRFYAAHRCCAPQKDIVWEGNTLQEAREKCKELNQARKEKQPEVSLFSPE